MNKKSLRFPKLETEQKKELVHICLVFFAVCAVCALVLSGVNQILSGVFEKNTDAPLRVAMEKVFPATEHTLVDFEFEEANGVSAVYGAYDEDKLLGYCVVTVAPDHDGEMKAVVAVDTEEKVLAIEVMSMPDGVGIKVKAYSFLSMFKGKRGKLTVVKGQAKNDSQIAAISGATVSSEAVTLCVNRALAAVSQISAEKAKEGEGA